MKEWRKEKKFWWVCLCGDGSGMNLESFFILHSSSKEERKSSWYEVHVYPLQFFFLEKDPKSRKNVSMDENVYFFLISIDYVWVSPFYSAFCHHHFDLIPSSFFVCFRKNSSKPSLLVYFAFRLTYMLASYKRKKFWGYITNITQTSNENHTHFSGSNVFIYWIYTHTLLFGTISMYYER